MGSSNGGARSQIELEHAREEGYEAYFEGLTPSDMPYDEYSGHVRDWWLAGWRAANEDDRQGATAS